MEQNNMDNNEIAKKLRRALTYFDERMINMANEKDPAYSDEFLELLKENMRYCESISKSLQKVITKLESSLATNSEKPAKRVCRALSTQNSKGRANAAMEKRHAVSDRNELANDENDSLPSSEKPTKRVCRALSTQDSNRRTKAMERRHAAIRKTVTERNEFINDENNSQINSTLIMGKNTKQEMHGRNSLYRSMCIYCNETVKGNMVQHYVKNHPSREVPISRLSPEMANRLRMQGDIFQRDRNKKISGHCYFCDENHNFLKFGWQTHLVAQTGEKNFNCTQCHAETKKQHDMMRCKNNVEHMVKEKKGGLVGFMCKDCNYFQFSNERLIDHLKNEHGFEIPKESLNFKEFIVVKME